MIDRAERANNVCRFLTMKVSEVAPAGLGCWQTAWQIVEEPSNRFLDALNSWERSGSAEDERRMYAEADAVLAAWREAARQWSAQRQQQLARTA